MSMISPNLEIILLHLLRFVFSSQFSTDQASISIASISFAPHFSAKIAKTPVPDPISSMFFPSNESEEISSHIKKVV